MKDLRQTRTALGLTLAEVARRAGISEATVSRVETGATTTPETLGKIHAALGLVTTEIGPVPGWIAEALSMLAPILAAVPDELRAEAVGEALKAVGRVARGEVAVATAEQVNVIAGDADVTQHNT